MAFRVPMVSSMWLSAWATLCTLSVTAHAVAQVAWPDGALRVATESSSPPPGWLEPPLEGSPHRLSPVSLVAVGGGVAVARAGSTHLIGRRDHGLIGAMVSPDDDAWIGLSGDGAVYAADVGGKLYRAEGPSAAVNLANFAEVGAVPGAERWDAAGQLVVAARGGQVFRSTDGGRSFQVAEPVAAGEAEVVDLVARFDGVVAARVRHAGNVLTYLSTDHGATWAPSDFHPADVERQGAWIMSGGEPIVVLSVDGRSWSDEVALADVDVPADLTRRTFVVSEHPRGIAESAEWLAADWPPPPPVPSEPVVGYREGQIGIAGRGTGLGVGGGGCQGIGCLRGTLGPSPPDTATEVGFAGDGLCEAEDADEDGFCEGGAGFSRPPHLVVFDQEAGQLVAVGSVPPNCQPQRLWIAQGLGVLPCAGRDGDLAIWVVGRDGQPVLEATFDTLPSPPTAIARATASEDGTILLHLDEPDGETGAAALVRAPRPVGERGVWRRVHRPDALTWRAGPNGTAVAFAQPDPDDPFRGAVLVDHPDGTTSPLASDLGVSERVVGTRVVEGRVVFHGRGLGEGGHLAWGVLTAEGIAPLGEDVAF